MDETDTYRTVTDLKIEKARLTCYDDGIKIYLRVGNEGNCFQREMDFRRYHSMDVLWRILYELHVNDFRQLVDLGVDAEVNCDDELMSLKRHHREDFEKEGVWVGLA